MQNHIEWSILDVEEDEWDRRINAIDVAAAANGFPVAARPGGDHLARDGPAIAGYSTSGRWISRIWSWRRLAASAAALLILAVFVVYNIWRTAQEGLAQIEADVANVVMLENIESRAKLPSKHSAETVESIELLGNAAMVQVVITQTLGSGKVTKLRQPRFYFQTATGWQPSAPVAAFWGPTTLLDTPNLHFIFGARDRAAVEQIAPTAELLYTGLMRATGQKLADDGPLIIEVVRGQYAGGAAYDQGRIQVTSPVFFNTGVSISSEEIFARLLRGAMCEPMLAAAIEQTPARPQWQPLLRDGFRCWPLNDIIAAQAPAAAAVFSSTYAPSLPGYMKLNTLLDWTFRRGSDPPQQSATSSQAATYYMPGAGFYYAQEGALGAAQLFAFVATTYGLDALPRLLRGFGEYDNWETLAPAVFGVSAAELEAAWHSDDVPE